MSGPDVHVPAGRRRVLDTLRAHAEVRFIVDSRRVVVIGTGLIGTSVALALRERGDEVRLADRDPRSLRLAVELGAGEPLRDAGGPADVAVLAVPRALRERGDEVRLADRDPRSLRLAVELGAGEPLRDAGGPADVAVLAVP